MPEVPLRWLGIMLLALHGLSSPATTVFPAEQVCPVCEEMFITTTIGSTSFFGDPARDLSDSPVFRFAGIETCPYCLYSSLKSSFEDLSGSEQKTLRQVLPTMPMKLLDPERRALLEIPTNHSLREAYFFGHLLARACNRYRQPAPHRDLELLLYLYFSTKGGRHNDLHAFYRSQVITRLTSLLAGETFEGGEEAVFTYLLGEMYRLEGQTEKALEYFDRAAVLSRTLPKSTNEDESSYEWIEQWAFEQSCRVHFTTHTAPELAAYLEVAEADLEGSDFRSAIRQKVALQTLASRHDAAVWSVLADYVMEDPRNLDQLHRLTEVTREKLQIEPRLWTWVQARYAEAVRQTEASGDDTDLLWVRTCNRYRRLFEDTRWDYLGSAEDAQRLASWLDARPTGFQLHALEIQPGDTLSSIADQARTSIQRLLELNSHITNPDRIGLGQKIETVAGPPGWPEDRVLANLDELIREESAYAIAYFLGWVKTLGPQSLSTFDGRLRDCFSALASVKPAWQVPPEADRLAHSSQVLLHTCLAMLQGEERAGAKLLRCVESWAAPNSFIALACLGAVHSKLAVDPVLRRLQEGSDFDFDLDASMYLSAVGTVADLPALKEIAIARYVGSDSPNGHRMDGFDRKSIEEVILHIRLEALVEESLLH